MLAFIIIIISVIKTNIIDLFAFTYIMHIIADLSGATANYLFPRSILAKHNKSVSSQRITSKSFTAVLSSYHIYSP